MMFRSAARGDRTRSVEQRPLEERSRVKQNATVTAAQALGAEAFPQRHDRPAGSKRQPSSKKLGHRLSLDQLARLVEVIVNDRLRINAAGVVHRRK